MTGVDRQPLLKIEGVTKQFGAVRALDDVELAIPGGLVFGLIGPNGSGKTTLFNVITAIGRANSGRVLYSGRNITNWKPHQIAKIGIARTFQNLRLFKRMTVFENVFGAQTSLADIRFWQQFLPGRSREARRRAEVLDLLDAVGLVDRKDALAQQLSLGQQRRLELARVLARKPDLLLLDEPAGGMTPQETEDMVGLLEEVAKTGRTVLLIEHKMGMVMRLCQRIVVFNFGRKIAEGTPEQIQSNPAVREAYLGERAVHA